MPFTIDLAKVRAEHEKLRAVLAACDALAEVSAVVTTLLPVRPLVLAHLKLKEQLYAELVEGCTELGDLGAAQTAHIFASSMAVQASAVGNFFASLDAAHLRVTLAGYRTVSQVLRARLKTEEVTVLPLYERAQRGVVGPGR